MRSLSPSEAESLAGRLMALWKFDPTEELPGGHCSRVYTDGPRVLKVPFQGEEQTTGRIAAERMSEGPGPRIFASDPESGSLLMDRLLPGEILADYSRDDRVTLPIFLDLCRRLDGLDVTGLMPLTEYFERKSALQERLVATQPSAVFLHGDLHHYNILRGGDRWFAIDPKGLVGDPAFEAIAYLRNPFDQFPVDGDLDGYFERRIVALASSLGVDPNRVWAWALVDRQDSDSPPDHPWGRMRTSIERLGSRFGLSV